MISADMYKTYQPIRAHPNASQWRTQAYEEVIDSLKQFDFVGKRILEVGPCYGYYSFWFDGNGAEVTAIESNAGRYEICEGLNEFYHGSVNFIHGDIMEYIKDSNADFDVLFLQNIFHHLLRHYKEEAFMLLNDTNIPWMFLTMGSTLGPWSLNVPKGNIPLMILNHSKYRLAKKIGKWYHRDTYFFER